MTGDSPTPRKLEQPGRFSLWLNALPVCLIGAGAIAAAVATETMPGAILFFAAWLYLAPPLLCRCLLTAFGRPGGTLTQDLGAYRVWWTTMQLQLPFNRIGWLEEILRLVPGLYAGWIWLWGGRLSPFCFVGPGVIITDRYLVNVDRGAVLGMRSALAGHMVTRDTDGRWQVVAAAPEVGAEAIVGGAAGLGPGARLLAGEMLPAGRRVAAFSTWPRGTAEQEDADNDAA